MIFALIVLAIFNTLLLVLSLAALGRIVRESNGNADAYVQGHNIVASRVRELSEWIESGIDCLVTLDAHQAKSSQDGNDK